MTVLFHIFQLGVFKLINCHKQTFLILSVQSYFLSYEGKEMEGIKGKEREREREREGRGLEGFS